MNTKTTKKIAINAIEIVVAGTKLRLTLDQITELKKILAEAFPDKETVYVPWPELGYSNHWPLPKFPHFGQWDITWSMEQASNSATLCLAGTP